MRVTKGSLEALAAAVEATKCCAKEEFATMTEEQARQVRRWRIDEDNTWRAVAQKACDAWGGDWGSNQLYGMVLCELAASLFDEDYRKPPWN